MYYLWKKCQCRFKSPAQAHGILTRHVLSSCYSGYTFSPFSNKLQKILIQKHSLLKYTAHARGAPTHPCVRTIVPMSCLSFFCHPSRLCTRWRYLACVFMLAIVARWIIFVYWLTPGSYIKKMRFFMDC